MGLAPIHSSIAISSMPEWPKGFMHQPIPDRSINWPISSSSGTRTASCERDRLAYLLVIEPLPGVHSHGVVDVGQLVDALAPCRRLLVLGDHAADDSVQTRTTRKPDVLREEDGHLLELI